MSGISLIYVAPWAYLIASRLRTRIELASWVLVNPLVVAFIAYATSEVSVALFTSAILLAFVAWQSVYETGYLENDLLTTEMEAAPTLRLESQHRVELRRRYLPLVAAKSGVAAIALVGLFLLHSSSPGLLNVGIFVAALAVSRLAFLLHNRMRSSGNILTYFLLSVAKYGAIPALFNSGTSWASLALVVILVFPLPRTIEHACKVKYGLASLARFIGDFDSFRPKYYALLAAVCGLIAVFGGPPETVTALAVALYFLVLRSIGFVLHKRNKRVTPGAYDWADRG